LGGEGLYFVTADGEEGEGETDKQKGAYVSLTNPRGKKGAGFYMVREEAVFVTTSDGGGQTVKEKIKKGGPTSRNQSTGKRKTLAPSEKSLRHREKKRAWGVVGENSPFLTETVRNKVPNAKRISQERSTGHGMRRKKKKYTRPPRRKEGARYRTSGGEDWGGEKKKSVVPITGKRKRKAIFFQADDLIPLRVTY